MVTQKFTAAAAVAPNHCHLQPLTIKMWLAGEHGSDIESFAYKPIKLYALSI